MPIFDVISYALICILCAVSGIAAGIIVWRILSLFLYKTRLQKFLSILIPIAVALIYGFAMHSIGMMDAAVISEGMKKIYPWTLFLPIPIAVVILLVGRALKAARKQG